MKHSTQQNVLICAAIACAAAIVVLASTFVPRTVDLRKRLTLEIADTGPERELGLGKRDSLPKDHGMLFVFEKPDIYSFWMKDVKFPLDIIWIHKGVVTDVVKMNPPKQAFTIPDLHVPLAKADRVLEVNAGVAKELGIEPGAHVLLPN